MRMTCSIIDDEPRAHDVLCTFIEKIPFLALQGMFRDPVEAVEGIAQHRPDLIFLDITMPDLTGMQLVRSIANPPLVIFTTAYAEYAVESYECNAVDYLLKPIEFDRFLRAVMKAKHLFDRSLTKKNGPIVDEKCNTTLFVKSGTKTLRLELLAILYIEGMGNYVNFVLDDGKKVTAYLSMSEVQGMLPANIFKRIHKSYIVSLHHILEIDVNRVKIKERMIPLGKKFKSEFLKTALMKRTQTI